MTKKTPWLTFSFYLLPLVWMGVIFYFSHQSVLPGSEVFWQDFIFKKTAHIGVYMVLAWSWFLTLTKTNLRQIKHRYLWIFLFCFIFALSDEWHQSFIPGRTATFRDIGFDSLGIIIALLWSYRVI